jgi:hypothetical protein
MEDTHSDYFYSSRVIHIYIISAVTNRLEIGNYKLVSLVQKAACLLKPISEMGVVFVMRG